MELSSDDRWFAASWFTPLIIATVCYIWMMIDDDVHWIIVLIAIVASGIPISVFLVYYFAAIYRTRNG